MDRPEYLIGVDLGRHVDYTAIVVAEKRAGADGSARYTLSHAERSQQPYPLIVQRVVTIVNGLHRAETVRSFDQNGRGYDDYPTITTILDATGVGNAVIDMFASVRLPGRMIEVTITGGDRVNHDGNRYRTPKRDLVAAVQVLLQGGRLEIPPRQTLASLISKELAGFQVTISLSGHDTYAAAGGWREEDHDDLVLGTALALWWGEQNSGAVWGDDTAAFLAAAFAT